MPARRSKRFRFLCLFREARFARAESRERTAATPSVFKTKKKRRRGVGHTETKSVGIYIRVAPHERGLLRQKAKRGGLSVSEYVRNAAIYGDSPITAIDTKPLAKLNWELIKQGSNLNQLMKFVNTYGEKAYDSDEVSRVLDKEIDVFDKVGEALISLRREADAHHVIINLEAPEYSEDD